MFDATDSKQHRKVYGKKAITYLLSRDRSVIYICTYQLLLPHWVLWIIRYTRNMFCDKIFCRLTLFSIFIAWDVLGKFHYICTVEEKIVRDLNNMQTSRLCRFTTADKDVKLHLTVISAAFLVCFSCEKRESLSTSNVVFWLSLIKRQRRQVFNICISFFVFACRPRGKSVLWLWSDILLCK